jgi:hypothetical protein
MPVTEMPSGSSENSNGSGSMDSGGSSF